MSKTAYLSFDIETDGPSPLTNSMLSLGIALIDDNANIIDELEVNILKRDNTVEDPSTMEFWKKNPVAWEQCHQNMISPQDAMAKVAEFYGKWSTQYKLIWMAMPVCFDWMFLKSYYMAFAQEHSPDIGFKATCGSTLRDYSIKTKIITNKQYDILVESLPQGLEHRSVDDAKHQGLIFVNLIKLIQSVRNEQTQNVASKKK
jgi:hypothetical protein